jgi:hypothetical protein
MNSDYLIVIQPFDEIVACMVEPKEDEVEAINLSDL